MSEAISEKQMIIETYVTVKELKEQIVRHRVEDRQNDANLWSELKSIDKKHSELKDDHGSRLLKLESERGILSKIITAVFGFGAGVGGGWLGKHM